MTIVCMLKPSHNERKREREWERKRIETTQIQSEHCYKYDTRNKIDGMRAKETGWGGSMRSKVDYW